LQTDETEFNDGIEFISKCNLAAETAKNRFILWLATDLLGSGVA
jgi:hypothetical protein